METRELVRTINEGIKNYLTNLHTNTIGRVVAVNSTTIDVQPVINRKVDGESIPLPVFKEVPPIFLQGGTSNDTFPIAVGDYCILIVMERCIDRWYSGQDEQPPLEDRMHDYSDAIAIVGVNPLLKALPIPEKVTRKGDQIVTGNVTHTGNYNQTGDFTQEGDFNLTGDMTIEGTTHNIKGNVNIDGNLVVTGNISGAQISASGGISATGSGGIDSEGDISSDGDISGTNITASGKVTMATMKIGATDVTESFFTSHTHSGGNYSNGAGLVTGTSGVPN